MPHPEEDDAKRQTNESGSGERAMVSVLISASLLPGDRPA
jgi:hypothetical protein